MERTSKLHLNLRITGSLVKGRIKLKDKIVVLLKEKKNEFLSGEELSISLGVTRAAIWKYINTLREEGYNIESSPKKGYKLLESPDVLTFGEIHNFLNTKFLGRNLIHYESIDSTNIKAKEIAREGCSDGTVVISEYQSSGKGRLGRQWVSPKGKGIWMSIILKPDVDPSFASKITLIGAASVLKAMNNLGINNCSIKWPNDIVINNKKVSGILTEMSAELTRINHIVIGIGINVNIDVEDFSEELKSIATSLKIEKNKSIDRKMLLAEVLNSFEPYYEEFIHNGHIPSTIDLCRENSILLQKEIQCIRGNSIFRAKAIDISDNGELIVELPDGKIEHIVSGEVSIRGLYGYVDS